eukprot:TRINITY_DN11355_c0_g1_i1.p1 TRINITY_DN11355_c0_g1~~TRINITY_DN11355_c0_g1_i1.p1  ORF type:complete len:915 (-),score=107.58 TRINITY_DN11355_c0_g1_i1:335-3022(-)
MTRLPLLLLGATPVLGSYDLWHVIDPMMVVCPLLKAPDPLPDNMTADMWPSKQEFKVVIDTTHGMLVDRPHVVSFMRTTSKSLTIKFNLKDKNGKEMVSSGSITLQGKPAPNANDDKCQCTGLNTNVDTAFYGAGYGKTCAAHDKDKCKEFWPGLTSQDVCCKAWCYVPGDCPSAFKSEAASGLYWSYAGVEKGGKRCADVQQDSTCAKEYAPPDPCTCVNVDSTIQASVHASKFASGYGAQCKTWDYKDCADNYDPSVIDSWCCESWCWVGKECKSALPSKVWEGLHWTTADCKDDQELVRTCPYKAEAPPVDDSKKDPSCDCIGYSPNMLRSGRRRAGTQAFDSKYGSTCQAWDKDYCSEYWPKHNSGMWCCQNWCYVDEECPSASASWILPGYFYSYSVCEDEGPALSECKYSDDCKPLGKNTGFSADNITKFGADYGTSCKAWDKDTCAKNYAGSNVSDWCCDSWAYVNKSCPAAIPSTISEGLFWSDLICPDDTSAAVWNNATNTCGARRLGDDQSDNDLARRLSGRRRSGGRSYYGGSSYSARRRSYSSWSSSGGRRRAPTPRRRSPVTSTPRRRAPVRPPATPRRRAQTFSPRRRASPTPPPTPATVGGRRRGASDSGSGASNFNTDNLRRRRTPFGDSRRRSADIYGGTYETSGGTHRRRVPYGYTNNQQVMYNYGGNVPMQTPYGYSGVAQKPNSKMNMAMGVAGGFALGAVAGVGGYYAYQRMTEGNWGGHHLDRSWCSTSAGYTMRCNDCYMRYGTTGCRDENECFTSNGCTRTIKTEAVRDDLMKTGFVPEEFTAPFVLTVTEIIGDDFAASKICPKPQPETIVDKNWESASSFGTTLFVTLTEMDQLDTQDASGADGLTRCWLAAKSLWFCACAMLALAFGQ